tara:strand:- start:2217 stop:2708 length:492 start_codon:yes stop_codon:yes gene_type:complete
MNKPTVHQYLTQSAVSCWGQSDWPTTLVAQHLQLDLEIDSIKKMLVQGNSSFIHIETRLRKLTKGLLIHLELEACFLAPILENSDISPSQKNSIKQGYDILSNTCHATSDYLHALKLSCGNALIETQQARHIGEFLKEIKNRLSEESAIYLPIKDNEMLCHEI